LRQISDGIEACDWEQIFDAIYDWVCLIDIDSEIIRSNMAGCDYFGLPSTKIVGNKCCKLVHGAEKPIEQCPLPKMLVSGKRESAEIKTQDNRWVLITVDPIYDDTGKIVKAVHILRDITASINIQLETDRLVLELQKAYKKVDTLSGLIPICSICKKIRDDRGYWNQLEKFIKMHANVDFSHGICPDCVKEHYPNVRLHDK
jgi:PAS domain S-box-containing protein